MVLLLELALRHTKVGGESGRRVAKMVGGGSTRVGLVSDVATHKDNG